MSRPKKEFTIKPKKKPAIEFSDAPEVQAMAVKLIDDHHSHLAEARICYLFRSGPWQKLKRETWLAAKRKKHEGVA